MHPAFWSDWRRRMLALAGFSAWICLTIAAEDMPWEQGDGYRFRTLPVPSSGRVGFTSMTPESTGVTFSNILSEWSAATNRIASNGSGVAAGDVDGDGWCDLYFCRLEGPNVLYRNLGGWKFEDVSAAAGVTCGDQRSTGAALADLDGDGDLDLLVNGIGTGTRSFRNDGKGRFTEITETRLMRQLGATSLTLGDLDHDGDLDLYVANYRTDTFKDHPPGLVVEARQAGGRIVVTPEERFIPLLPRQGGVEVIERGEVDALYLNDGSGRFGPVSWTKGAFLDEDGKVLAGPPTDWVLSAMFRDINQDGFPDLYTCADFFYWPDRMWLSEESRSMKAASRLAFRHMSVSAMSVDFADVNRDGLDDYLVTDMVSRRHAFRQRQRPNMMEGILEQPVERPEFRPEVAHNTLFVNRGDGTYAEVAYFSGLAWTEWTWSGVFLDVDLDGYEDVLISNGNQHDVQDADVLMALARIREEPSFENNLKNLRKFPSLETANLAFRNRGDLTFEEVGNAWGFDLKGVSHGMALADLDGDGDLDVVLNNLNRPASLLRNESAASRVAVRLKGRAPNTRGIGARIRVLGGPVVQSQEMLAGGRYLSSDEPVRAFAGGTGDRLVDIEVRWRSGRYSMARQLPVNRLFEIDEAAAAEKPPAGPAESGLAWFEDASARLLHNHTDEPFNDFERQPLLPRRFSTPGPGITWFDLDGDGWEDLVVPSGRGGRMLVARNDGSGGFVPIVEAPWHEPVTRDQTSVLGWRSQTGLTRFVAGLAIFEDATATGSSVVEYEVQSKLLGGIMPADVEVIGPLALGDVDGDGDLDLFAGTRMVAGRYPEAAPSRILLNEGGRFLPGLVGPSLPKPDGLVNGGVFTDLDGDGRLELVLACDWGPLRVFRFQPGGVVEITKAVGLDRFDGWWNGVTAGDFDGDGRMDLVASNWGRNNKHAAVDTGSLRLYYGDFAGHGGVDLIEAYQDAELGKTVPWRDWLTLTRSLPFIRETHPGYAAFGQASVADLLDTAHQKAGVLEASVLDSMVFLNRGSHFEARPLPPEAQWAPAFGVVVADWNGDGHEDLFLAQNFFGTDPDTSRHDAGRGLCLLGDGRGGFRSVAGQISGVKIYGEQRGAAVADYDADGRWDLAVGQNRGSTKLYRNTIAKPGLRVRLISGDPNSGSVGAALRVIYAQRSGPMREIRAGSGYLSQDGAIQVLALPEPGVALWVRWPDGRTGTYVLPPGAKEVAVRADRGLERLR